MGQLDLFVAKLSTVFQPLASFGDYERLIYNSNSLEFKKDTALRLIDQGITIAPEVLKLLNEEVAQYSFIDTFTDSNGVNLVGAHSPDTLASSWSFLGGSTPGAYVITGNTLTKNTSGDVYISPIPNPVVSSGDYSISFKIGDFGGGPINVYLRYIDTDNYYKLQMTPSGYQTIHRIAGVDTVYHNVNHTINAGETIIFSIQGDTFVFSIDGFELENYGTGQAVEIGKVALSLQNSSASIDDFSFIYR